MVAEQETTTEACSDSCSLAKISMVAELVRRRKRTINSCSLAKISMVAEHQLKQSA